MSSQRLADLFRVLKGIRRCTDEWRELAGHAIEATPPPKRRSDEIRDRGRADALRAAADVEGLYALCEDVIASRECAITALETVAGLIDVADIVPRTHNMGPSARLASKRRPPL